MGIPTPTRSWRIALEESLLTRELEGHDAYRDRGA
jgi:hypothetical protein